MLEKYEIFCVKLFFITYKRTCLLFIDIFESIKFHRSSLWYWIRRSGFVIVCFMWSKVFIVYSLNLSLMFGSDFIS
jgi:hypothetical protein